MAASQASHRRIRAPLRFFHMFSGNKRQRPDSEGTQRCLLQSQDQWAPSFCRLRLSPPQGSSSGRKRRSLYTLLVRDLGHLSPSLRISWDLGVRILGLSPWGLFETSPRQAFASDNLLSIRDGRVIQSNLVDHLIRTHLMAFRL